MGPSEPKIENWETLCCATEADEEEEKEQDVARRYQVNGKAVDERPW